MRKNAMTINRRNSISIEDLSPFKEEHQDLLKLHVLSFRDEEFSVWGQIFKKRIFFEVEKCGVRKLFRIY